MGYSLTKQETDVEHNLSAKITLFTYNSVRGNILKGKVFSKAHEKYGNISPACLVRIQQICRGKIR